MKFHLLHADPGEEGGELPVVVRPDALRGRPHPVGGQPRVERGQRRRAPEVLGVGRVVVGEPVRGGPSGFYPWYIVDWVR